MKNPRLSNVLHGWDAVVGENYRVEFKSNLGDAESQTLATVTVASPASTIVSSEGERYYRIVSNSNSSTANE